MTDCLVVIERSSVKTIRIPKSLEKILEREAKNRKMSLNTFITSVLTKFVEWDRLADKFGMLSIPDEVLLAIIDSLDDTQIEKLAIECGSRTPRAIMEFWFSRVTPETFLSYLSLRSTYHHFVNHEVVTVDDGQLVITARHEHGRKWSVWSCNYLAEAIRTNFGVNSHLEINGNTFRIECPRLAKGSINA